MIYILKGEKRNERDDDLCVPFFAEQRKRTYKCRKDIKVAGKA
jgi:hypothetical protein